MSVSVSGLSRDRERLFGILADVVLRPRFEKAEAERARRARVISAEGEYQASKRLGQAADVMEQHPAALQLRFLQTVGEIAAENISTTLFPIPIDLFAPFVNRIKDTGLSGPTEEIMDEDLDALPEDSDRKVLTR